jgi:predicted NUDIX family phosphoesterase
MKEVMTTVPSINSSSIASHHQENILVVPRTKLFPDITPQGFIRTQLEMYQERIEQAKQFLPRAQMEQDPSYKQIIPYLVFAYENRIFLMQRKGSAGESRLASKYTIGIGGHIRKEDFVGSSISDWARREFAEEIDYHEPYTITPLGLLNDERNAVGTVHTGFVFLLTGTSASINIREELAHGRLATLQECRDVYPLMESWSQLLIDSFVNDGLKVVTTTTPQLLP